MKYSYNAVKKLLKFARESNKQRTILDCTNKDINFANRMLKRRCSRGRHGFWYKYLYRSKDFIARKDVWEWYDL